MIIGLSILAWFTVGYFVGKRAAAYSYSSRNESSYYMSSKKQDAQLWFFVSFFTPPIGVVYLLSHRAISQVPEVKQQAEEKRNKELESKLKEAQQIIDQFDAVSVRNRNRIRE